MTIQHIEPRHRVHLSYAGFCAGQRLCGISPENGPRAIFALWADPETREALHVCPKCRKVWDRELEENE